MKIYNVIIEDRHVDVEAYPFSDKEKAIEFARNQAKELAAYSNQIKEKDIESWILYIFYSEEDCISVREYELDKEK